MPLPGLDPSTGNLPPGVHESRWDEVVAEFGFSAKRQELLEGRLRALQTLRVAGCRRAYVDGSFVTSKETPGDFDGCWEPAGVDPSRLDSVLLDFDNKRAAQKAKYGGEFFIATAVADSGGARFIDFFQRDKFTGLTKGIVAIDLGGLP